MRQAARVNAAGAQFVLLGAKQTMLPSTKPVIAIGAVRTGCGKSQTSRRVAEILKGMGLRVAVVRHPMPYGDLSKQICQRFASVADMDTQKCTIEEREEYEPHIAMGNLVFAGVDYELILRRAEAGGRRRSCGTAATTTCRSSGPTSTSWWPTRTAPATSSRYYPGETNLRMADLVIVNKVDTAERRERGAGRGQRAGARTRGRVMLRAALAGDRDASPTSCAASACW